MQALAFLAVFVYATQAIAFEWKPGFKYTSLLMMCNNARCYSTVYWAITVCSTFFTCLLLFQLMLAGAAESS